MKLPLRILLSKHERPRCRENEWFGHRIKNWHCYYQCGGGNYYSKNANQSKQMRSNSSNADVIANNSKSNNSITNNISWLVKSYTSYKTRGRKLNNEKDARLWRCQLTTWPCLDILEAAASLRVQQYFCAVLICFYGIVAKCFEPLKDVHCYNDNI